MAASDTDSRLTRRQAECMGLVAKGQTAKHIARDLGISHRTVEHHIAAAIEALDAKNRLGAVALFLELERQKASQAEQAAFMLQEPAHPAEKLLVRDDASASKEVGKPSQSYSLFPSLGGSVNDAPRRIRIGWFIRIALVAMMLSCAAILSILGLIEIVR